MRFAPWQYEKKKDNPRKEMVSPNSPNKHELTFYYQGNFLSSGMRRDCISEYNEMLFNQFLLP